MEDQVKEMNENNLAMEEVPSTSSEDKPSLSQPMNGTDYDTDIVMTIVTIMKIMGMRERFIGLHLYV